MKMYCKPLACRVAPESAIRRIAVQGHFQGSFQACRAGGATAMKMSLRERLARRSEDVRHATSNFRHARVLGATAHSQ